MNRPGITTLFTIALAILLPVWSLHAQQDKSFEKVKKASKKVESGYKKLNSDTVAQGYFDLGESYYQKGDLQKSESYYQKARNLYVTLADAEGIAKASRALAQVQEELHKTTEAIKNYKMAEDNTSKTGNITSQRLNSNDIQRLNNADSAGIQTSLLRSNISLGLANRDTGEIVSNYSRMADVGLKFKNPAIVLDAYNNAYYYSRQIPEQALQFNQKITDVYLKNKNYSKALETKKDVLKESFVQGSTRLQASEINSLADIYLQIKDDSTAIRLLNEAYSLSIRNGHTLQARTSVEKLDSVFQNKGRSDLSLRLYKDFLKSLPGVIARDSTIADGRLIAETEGRIRELETEKALKDALIRRKNIFNYWLIGSLMVMGGFVIFILFIMRKLRIKNKKIALQSLRREMNPHFIFNSLNSINQFIAANNELEANQYLTRFSTLMRRVMENSKEDFVLFSKELELLQNYLDLEKSRFPDKFDFTVTVDDSLLAEEALFIPGMLIQPHLENAIWHGLRYAGTTGRLQLRFSRENDHMIVIVEDNGIGIAESRKTKTENQRKHSGRGITNTQERIRILNELYHQDIRCEVEDKTGEETGVKVTLTVPVIKNWQA